MDRGSQAGTSACPWQAIQPGKGGRRAHPRIRAAALMLTGSCVACVEPTRLERARTVHIMAALAILGSRTKLKREKMAQNGG